MIVGLTGYAGSGKDTVGSILVGCHSFVRVSFAERLKAMALDLDPLLELRAREGDEDLVVPSRLSAVVTAYGSLEAAKYAEPAVREYLQALGTKARTHLGPHVWVDAVKPDLMRHNRVVLTDVRFRNEADLVRQYGGKVLRVTRPGVGAVNGHASEHDLDDYPMDGEILNDREITDLHPQIYDLVRTLDTLPEPGRC